MIACVVTAGAIAIEAVADRHYGSSRTKKSRSGEIIDYGAFGHIQAPNYFRRNNVLVGYISLWPGCCPDWCGLSSARYRSPILFTFVSVPLMDKGIWQKGRIIRNQKENTGSFPWFPKHIDRSYLPVPVYIPKPVTVMLTELLLSPLYCAETVTCRSAMPVISGLKVA